MEKVKKIRKKGKTNISKGYKSQRNRAKPKNKFHESLVFINSFHLRLKILLRILQKILFKKETDRERCQAKKNTFLSFSLNPLRPISSFLHVFKPN